MKKGVKLLKVITKDGHVTAIDTNGEEVKLSRSERNVLTDYKDKNYINNIRKVFGNNDAIADGFTMEKNGVIKFTYTNNMK